MREKSARQIKSIRYPAQQYRKYILSTIVLLAGMLLLNDPFRVANAAIPVPNVAGRQQVPAVRGDAAHHATLNFTELADRERLAPPRIRKPRKIHEPLEPEEEARNKQIPPGANIQVEEPFALRQEVEASLSTPGLTANFLALDDDNTHIPPDTHGAAGPNHLMVTLNTQVRIQTRAGSTISTVSLGGFWAVFGHSNVFDPRITYDPYANRWVFVSLTDFRTTTSSLQIGASQTGDPTGNWYLYDIRFDTSGVAFGDYPTVGFNNQWIVVTSNTYRISDSSYIASNIYVFNKASLYAGQGSPFTLFKDSTGNAQAPALTYDNTVSTMYIVENWNGNSGGSGSLRLSTITGAVGSEVLTLGVAFPSTPNPWDSSPPSANFAPQLGSSQKIVAGDSDIQNTVYRNGSLWCAQTVFLPAGGSATRCSIQWWQLSTSGAIQQRGRIDDSSGKNFYAYPSIAVNQNSDVLIGYSRFSATQYAGASYAFRAASDAANTLRSPNVLKDGLAPYNKTNGGTKNKWGDFSNTVVDPVNNLDFWTIQEYAAAPSGGVDRWGTWWGYISLSSSPPPPPAGEVVLYASEATTKVGNYSVVADATAAGGARMWNPDAGAAKLSNALAAPANYFEINFNAQAGVPYHLWVRGKADSDSPYNDSFFVQFSGSVSSGGTATDRIGTTASEVINLEDCSGCGLSGWGWQDNGWGVGVMGPNLYFQTTGTQTLRIQPREDGLSIDQIVLSPQTYLNSSPGALKNDTTILSKSGGAQQPAPTVTSIAPGSGTTTGGTSVTITGSNFVSGATVSFGGTAATNVTVASSTSISATTPAHAAGTVNVTVTNSDGQSGTLANAFIYTSPQNPPPTISSISPTSGPTTGNTSVTITGTGFLTGAGVSFGGVAAGSVTVVSSTTITAITPAHSAGSVNVVVTNSDGQSGTLTGGYTYVSSPPSETVLLADDFNANSLDTTKWAANDLFSGYTDATVAVADKNQELEIGPLPTGASGSHYNGIRSANLFNFSGAYCYVSLVQAPATNTTADAMLTIGTDVDNYYRIYVEAGVLYLQKRIQGGKTTLASRSYSATNHRYLRIRHDSASGAVVFEAAADNGGVPGAWTVLYSETWDSAHVVLSTIRFELKAGTWQSEANAPGKIIFDNFRAAKPQ